MKYAQMQEALVIISKCDCLSITEDDKPFVISVLGSIIKSLAEVGISLTEIKIHYEILKVSTWSNGYFCQKARYLCSQLYPKVELCSKLFDN